MRFALLASCIILTVAGVESCQQASAQPSNPNMARILTQWTQSQDSAKAIKYTYTGKRKRDADGEFPAQEFDLKREFTIDWETGRYRKVTQDISSKEIEEWTQVFDGKVIKARQRRLKPDGTPVVGFQEKVGIGSGSLKHNIFTSEYWPLFFAHGGILGRPDDSFYPGHFRFPIDPEALYFHRTEGTGTDFREVVRTYPTGTSVSKSCYEYHINPSLGGAVTQFHHLRLGGGKSAAPEKILSLDIGYRRHAGAVDIANWTHTWYSGSRILFREFFKIDKVERDLVMSEGIFDIQPNDNELVVKNTYVPPESGRGEVNIDSKLYQQTDGSLVPVEIVDGKVVPKSRPLWIYVVAVGGCVLLGGAKHNRIARIEAAPHWRILAKQSTRPPTTRTR